MKTEIRKSTRQRFFIDDWGNKEKRVERNQKFRRVFRDTRQLIGSHTNAKRRNIFDETFLFRMFFKAEDDLLL